MKHDSSQRPPLRPRTVVALVCAGVLLFLLGLGGAWLHRRGAASMVEGTAGALARRLGVDVRVHRHGLGAWDEVVLHGVRIHSPGSESDPLFTADRVRIRAGLSLGGGLVPAAIDVERPRLRLGADLLPVLRRALTWRRSRVAQGAGRRLHVPRVVLHAGAVVSSEGARRAVWEVPLATLVPAGSGKLQGSAELRDGNQQQQILALSGRPQANGYVLTVEAPQPVRLGALGAPLGRAIAVRALRFDRAGLSLLGVEVGLPAQQGKEVVARLPSVRLSGDPGGDGLKLELTRPELSVERYADGRLNIAGAPAVGLSGPSKRLPTGLTAWADLLGGPPTLSVRDGRIAYRRYRREEEPWSLVAHHVDLRLVPASTGYSGTLAWLVASGSVAGPEAISLSMGLDTLDLPHVARSLGARLLAGRADGTLHLLMDGPVVRVVGNVRADDLGLSWALLSRLPVEGLDLSADFDAEWDRDLDEVRVSSLALGIGRAELSLWGTLIDSGGRGQFDLRGVLGPVPCDDVVTSLPLGLRPELPDLRLAGHVTLRGRTWGRLENLKSLRVDLDGAVEDFAVVAGGKDVGGLAGAFIHEARIPDGVTRRFPVGEAGRRHARLDETPAALRNAIVASEDMGFWRHDGFDRRQIAASLERNLRNRRVERGGSTLTQQLAKNLYLRAEKTIARKLQEAYLTWRIERSLPKARILELYVNVVEWGPGVYGITEAARYYFDKTPRKLGLRECAFLAAILPNPTRLGSRDDEGRLAPLVRRRIDRIVRRMRTLGYLRGPVAGRARPRPGGAVAVR